MFSGESKFETGTSEFFEEHGRTLLYELGGAIPSIFLSAAAPGSRILDAGCGIGFWTHEFEKRGAAVTAIDLSDQSASLTLKRLQSCGLPARLAAASVDRLPFPGEVFDHINCLHVLNYLPDPRPVLREFARVLRPGGTLCFSVHYKMWVLRHPALLRAALWLCRRLFRLQDASRAQMLRASSPEELVRMFDGAENPYARAFSRAELLRALEGCFEAEEEMKYGLPLRALVIPLPRFLHDLLNRLFGIGIVLRCRRIEGQPREGMPAKGKP